MEPAIAIWRIAFVSRMIWKVSSFVFVFRLCIINYVDGVERFNCI